MPPSEIPTNITRLSVFDLLKHSYKYQPVFHKYAPNDTEIFCLSSPITSVACTNLTIPLSRTKIKTLTDVNQTVHIFHYERLGFADLHFEDSQELTPLTHTHLFYMCSINLDILLFRLH